LNLEFSDFDTLTYPNSPFLNCFSYNAEIFTKRIGAINGHGKTLPMTSLGPALNFLQGHFEVDHSVMARQKNAKLKDHLKSINDFEQDCTNGIVAHEILCVSRARAMVQRGNQRSDAA
jgi:hypothetical protein